MDVKLIVYIVYSYWLSDFKALVLNWGGTLSVVGKTCWLQTDRTRYKETWFFSAFYISVALPVSWYPASA